MAVIKQRLNYKTEDGTYKTVHLETSSDLVLREDGTSIEAAMVAAESAIAGKADASHTHSEITSLSVHISNKQNPHGVTAAQIGAAAADHTHTAAAVGAAASNHTHTAAQVGALPSTTAYVPPTRKVNNKALSADISLTAADVGAAAASHTHAYAASNHSHAAGAITAGTLIATILATNGTDYGTSRLRNISAGTGDLTAGSSALANGAIYLVYE